MPTPESAEAFAKLVAARVRLTEITKLVNEWHSPVLTDLASKTRYYELHVAWDKAHQEFQAATEEFSSKVKAIRRPE